MRLIQDILSNLLLYNLPPHSTLPISIFLSSGTLPFYNHSSLWGQFWSQTFSNFEFIGIALSPPTGQLEFVIITILQAQNSLVYNLMQHMIIRAELLLHIIFGPCVDSTYHDSELHWCYQFFQSPHFLFTQLDCKIPFRQECGSYDSVL